MPTHQADGWHGKAGRGVDVHRCSIAIAAFIVEATIGPAGGESERDCIVEGKKSIVGMGEFDGSLKIIDRITLHNCHREWSAILVPIRLATTLGHTAEVGALLFAEQ